MSLTRELSQVRAVTSNKFDRLHNVVDENRASSAQVVREVGIL
jgi:hypothetical protein